MSEGPYAVGQALGIEYAVVEVEVEADVLL